MRTVSLVLMVAVMCALIAPVSLALADTGSISRDARGTATYGEHDPLGGPPTPRIHGFGQATIFALGIAFLGLAALLGVYTFISVRRSPAPR